MLSHDPLQGIFGVPECARLDDGRMGAELLSPSIARHGGKGKDPYGVIGGGKQRKKEIKEKGD